MFWLSTSTVVRLRDQLRAAGQKAAVSVGSGSEHNPEDVAALKAEFGPLCEAMYLMMSADGDVSTEEREVLSGAMRNLSSSALDGDIIEQMVEEATKRSVESGRKARLEAVIE